MTRYSVQPRDKIFVKGHRFLSFAKSLGKNIGKNISKNSSSKYSKKLLNHAKQSATDAHNCFKGSNLKKQQKQLVIWLVTTLLIKLQKKSPQNTSETDENETEIPKGRYVSPE